MNIAPVVLANLWLHKSTSMAGRRIRGRVAGEHDQRENSYMEEHTCSNPASDSCENVSIRAGKASRLVLAFRESNVDLGGMISVQWYCMMVPILL